MKGNFYLRAAKVTVIDWIAYPVDFQIKSVILCIFAPILLWEKFSYAESKISLRSEDTFVSTN